MSLVSDLWSILTRRQRRQVLAAQAISVAMAFSTVTGIAAIAPFFAVLGEPRLIDHNRLLHAVYVYGHFSSRQGFVLALGAAFIGLVLLANVINALGSLTLHRLALRIGSELQASLFREYLARPYVFHTGTDSTTLFNNIVYETARITSGVLQHALVLLTNLVTASFIMISVLLFNPVVCIALFLALAGGYGLIYLGVRGRLLRIGQSHSRAWLQRARIVTESLGAIREILLLRDRGVFHETFTRTSADVAETNARIHLLGQVPKHVMECVAVTALVGAALVREAHTGTTGQWLGELTFIAFAAYRLLPTLQQVFLATVRIRADRAALIAVAPDLRQSQARGEVILPGGSVAADPRWPEHPPEEIRLEDVSFHYSTERPAALEGINVLIPAGAAVGIVGANGSGKTTLMDLIAGLLVPTRGELRVDGVALEAANRAAWQCRVAYVPQSIFLLDSTIAHNIAFGSRPGDIDRPRMMQAARLAQLEDFIGTLPDGYDHAVGERGVRLSGGQRQRVGLARALYKGAAVLLLDEAMSALDGMTETELMVALGSLRGRCTIVLVAHRLSMVRWCDVIFQLEKGRIGASGTYEELTHRSDRFRRIMGA